MEHYIAFNDQDPKEAVAMWGGAREDLEVTLQTGIITPVAPYNMVDIYQTRIKNNGLHLYYMSAVIANIPNNDPLSINLISGYEDDKQATYNMGFSVVEQLSEFYAGHNALTRPFANIFGDRLRAQFSCDEVVKLALDMLPNLPEQKIVEIKRQAAYAEEDIDLVQIQMIKSCLNEDDLTTLLKSIIKRKGVIFYCNSKLFDQDIRLGFESQDEILVTPNKQLTSEVLIGAKCLTEFDLPFYT